MTIYIGDVELQNSGAAAGAAFSAGFNAGDAAKKKKKKNPLDPNALPDTGTVPAEAPDLNTPEMTA